MFRFAMKVFGFALCAVLLLCSETLAETRVGTFTVTPLAGYHAIDGGLGLDDSASFGLASSYHITKNWALEGDVRYTPTETDASNPVDVDIWALSLNVLYHFRPGKPLTPYLLFGLGGLIYDVEGVSGGDDLFRNDEDYMGNWGGGFKYSLTERVALRFDVRHILNYRNDVKQGPDWRHHLQALAGLTFQLGGTPSLPVQETRMAEPVLDQKPKTKPAMPSQAVVAAQPQPMDSDSDGVFDADDKCPGTAPGVRVNASGCPADTDGDGVFDFKDACVDTPPGTEVDAQGCPHVEEPVATLAVRINFGVDKATVTPFHYAELQKASDFIARYPEHRIDVQGHTDGTGDADYNQQLSERRAESVREALVERYGIDPDRVTFSGAGESQPIASNETEEGRSENRRVEIDILP